jgi:hypothetical protein
LLETCISGGAIYIAEADNSLCDGEDKYHLEQNKKEAGDLIARYCNRRQIVAYCSQQPDLSGKGGSF